MYPPVATDLLPLAALKLWVSMSNEVNFVATDLLPLAALKL